MSPYVVTLVTLAIAAISLGQSTQEAPECGVNQKWSLCGRMCEPSCGDPKPNPMFCPKIVCSSITAACRCKKDTVRRDSESCVPVDQCPK